MTTKHWMAGVALALASTTSSAITLTSNAAGYASTTGPACSGDSGSVEIEITYIVPITGSGGCQRQGIVEFDLSSVTAPAVSSAVLTVYDGKVGNSEGRFWTIDVYGYTGNGQVTGSDLGAGTFLTSAIWDRQASDADVLTIDVTAFFNGLLSGGAGFAGLSLRAPDFTSSFVSAPIFLAFDGGGGDRPPTLELAPVPIPGGLALFGPALAALAVVRSYRGTAG
jgi:hypothetical protein